MYAEWVEQMNDAKSAAARNAVVERMCRMFAFGRQKAYKVLAENGWSSGRRKRSDAGTSSVSSDNLDALAAVLQNSLRKNGKKTMSVSIARSILKENGFDIPIEDSRLRELLRERTLSTESTRKASPHQRMRTERPNQVHFADPSVALLYFAPNGGQHILRDDEVYKNKPFLEGKENLKCWRYVLTDHYSSSICVRYYAAKGESAANMYDFLLYAWKQKKDPLYGFHGLPELLIWDCGSANISKPVTKALTALRVETKPHLPGNPRAKGQVEKANDIVETQFECRLRLEPVHSIEELNEAAEKWCAAFNANAIDGLDTRLTRNGRTIGSRQMLWNRILKQDLRELPDEEICRQIFTTGVQVRKVAGDLTVSISHPKTKRAEKYSVASLPGILVGASVNVQPLLVDEKPLAIVSYELAKETVSYEVEPIVFDEAGFDVNAPVFGKEYKSQKDTLVEKNVKRLSELAGAENKDDVPFKPITNGAGLRAHSFIKGEDTFARQTTGRQIEVVESTVARHEILITAVETAKRFKARTGCIPEGFISKLKKEFPEGVPASMVDELVYEYEDSVNNVVKFA